jgi:hypothetical protein
MNTTITNTVSNTNTLATTAIIATAATIVSAIFGYYYTSDIMSFTQEFSAFGLGW